MSEVSENLHLNLEIKMQEPFGKFYSKTFTGSMRGSGSHVIALMAYAIANAKPPDGVVEINVELAAFQIGDSVERIQEALEYLLSPDPKSRSQVDDGRRMVRVGEYLYRLVNWKTYRDGTDYEARRAYWADRQKAHRAAKKGGGEVVPAGEKPPQEPVAKFKKPTIAELELHAAKIGLAIEEVDKFLNYYESNGWRVGRNPMKSWQHALVNWKNNLKQYGPKQFGKPIVPPDHSKGF